MAVDNRQQSQLNGLAYDPLRNGYPLPHFTNPWVSGASGPPSSHLYPTSQPASNGLESLSQSQRPTSISLPYSGLPVTASPLGAGSSLPGGPYDPALIDASQDLLNGSRSYGTQYTSSGPSNTYLPTSGTSYPVDYGAASRSPYTYADTTRRSSHPSVASPTFLGNPLEVRRRPSSLIDFDRMEPQPRNSFSDALDASRGMVAMSQDITPRNIYGAQGSSRSSSDSYGFPPTHSAHSSISSASTYPSYYNGSVAESSVSDYSSASESVDMNTRTLPRPSGLIGNNMPPAPQSMMGQFSSKVSSSSQKKHKCKICDKRFTRPSSLQTHMYSHTGEKRKSIELVRPCHSLTSDSSFCLRGRRMRSPFFSRLQSPATSQSTQE
jgi:Zinc finger, C2H2 type